MERFLITLSLGPVQSLIGAARRTRDLWCGSWLLSEAARAAARALHQEQPGCLIFPCPEDADTDLAPQTRPRDTANIANILRAEVDLPDAEAARVLCVQAGSAAVSRLVDLGDSARSAMKKLGKPVRPDVWQAQIDDILEGFAAWVSVAAGSDGYTEAGKRLGGALAARKATRDFRACKPLSTPGLPKSSLDGALETVLPEWSDGDRARRKLHLSDGEQLDALGVIKRLAGDSEQFTAYSRIAADPWIEQLTSSQQQRLRDCYEALVPLELATRVKGNDDIYAALPYDAQMLYAFRLDNALSSAKSGPARAADSHGRAAAVNEHEQNEHERQALRSLRVCIDRISQETTDTGRPAGTPVPYAAILKADGDRMGALLSCADSAERSRSISRALHGFASKVREIVRTHRGHAIYAGGDDVLALVPLAQAQVCAKALADTFRSSLWSIASDMGIPDRDRPTLSVGLGIGHLMEPLGALRARADRAEKEAKGDAVKAPCNALAMRARADRAEKEAKGDAAKAPRNALAIILGIRSGAELTWRARWDDEDALDALSRLTEAYRDGLLPARAAYDLRSIDLRLAWLRGDESASARGMRDAEVVRMLERVRSEGGSEGIPGDLQELIRQRAGVQPLAELASTLIIARWLSARVAGDLGERT